MRSRFETDFKSYKQEVGKMFRVFFTTTLYMGVLYLSFPSGGASQGADLLPGSRQVSVIRMDGDIERKWSIPTGQVRRKPFIFGRREMKQGSARNFSGFRDFRRRVLD